MNQRTAERDEAARLEAVHRYEVLDTPPDGAFDRITALAAKIFDVPICIVSIVDHDRIWFKSHHGLDVIEIDRAPGLCASAILQHEPWVVTDATLDPRTLTNPLVCGEMGLRFYVGIPLKTSDGYNLGTFNIIDFEPRSITDEELQTLNDLAQIVVDELELRLSARRLVEWVRERRRQGVQLNDNVVQDLAVAKFAIEMDEADKAREAVTSALNAAKKIATELLESADPVSSKTSDLIREEAAGVDPVDDASVR